MRTEANLEAQQIRRRKKQEDWNDYSNIACTYLRTYYINANKEVKKKTVKKKNTLVL